MIRLSHTRDVQLTTKGAARPSADVLVLDTESRDMDIDDAARAVKVCLCTRGMPV